LLLLLFFFFLLLYPSRFMAVDYCSYELLSLEVTRKLNLQCLGSFKTFNFHTWVFTLVDVKVADVVDMDASN